MGRCGRGADSGRGRPDENDMDLLHRLAANQSCQVPILLLVSTSRQTIRSMASRHHSDLDYTDFPRSRNRTARRDHKSAETERTYGRAASGPAQQMRTLWAGPIQGRTRVSGRDRAVLHLRPHAPCAMRAAMRRRPADPHQPVRAQGPHGTGDCRRGRARSRLRDR